MTYMTAQKRRSCGFTLIELLIVIAIIAIIASVVFVALNPLRRFRDSRDAARWHDISELMHAIVLDQVDNGGTYLSAIETMTTGSVYMIGLGNSGCDDQNGVCDTDVSGDLLCVDLTGLTSQGYIAEVPISPNGQGTWTANVTGYTLMTSTSGAITLRACESENTSEISLTR